MNVVTNLWRALKVVKSGVLKFFQQMTCSD